MIAIINMRNLLTWPRAMAAQLEDAGLDVVLLDNASTYKPLLRWYKTCPYRVIRLAENVGHLAPWLTPALRDEMNEEPYIVTDPDIGIEDLPRDWLKRSHDLIDSGRFTKVGFPLLTSDLPANPLGSTAKWYEAANALIEQWRDAALIFQHGILPIPVDTTLAVYAAGRQPLMDGVCMPWRYAVRHLPWYVSPLNLGAEYQFYIDHAVKCSTLGEYLK